MKMRGRIGKGKCHVAGHGHAHMKGASHGRVCELTAEVGSIGRPDEKRQSKREIDESPLSVAESGDGGEYAP